MDHSIVTQGSDRWDLEFFDSEDRLCHYINDFTNFDEARVRAQVELRTQFAKAVVLNEYGQEALTLRRPR